MCLITRQKEPEILSRDIRTFKVLKVEDGVPPCAIHQTFWYELNQLYETDIVESELPAPYDSKVTEFYVLDASSYNAIRRNLKEYDLIALGKGFHSFANRKRAAGEIWRTNYELFECLIPAGSEIFYDETGLCVSNKIKILKQI
ncbi:MAG: hypothetical protein WC979_03145 [Candidatus Pacearchaeota archaeon]|jgi:hypothetical protein|nr:hypothetical protein [Clostridia bacterium]